MSSVDEEAVKAMTWRAIQEINGLTWANDADLITTLMRSALSHGFNFDKLEAFRGARGIGCFGFFRDRTHYVGTCMIRVGYSGARGGIMAQTEGEFGGVWAFLLDSDSSILTSRDGKGVESYNGLEGPELIQAVITSALTIEPTPQPAPERRRWFRRS